MFYYAGISPTPPKLVYRTGADKTPWVKPMGLEAYRKLKQARGVFGHRLNDIWNDVGPQVRDLLLARNIAWTSIDVVRFLTDGDGDEKIRGPVVIWVGVVPGSLDTDAAFGASNDILALLALNAVDDVEVEYRESVFTPSAAGPALLPSVSSINTTVDVRGPLTPALGLCITPSQSPDAQGTMGLYFAEGGGSDRVLGLTCRHVLFKTDEDVNEPYVFPGAGGPRKDVQLLGHGRFEKLLEDIKLHIDYHGITVRIYDEQIAKLKTKLAAMDAAHYEAAAADEAMDATTEEAQEEARDNLEETQRRLHKTHKAIADLERSYGNIKKEWGAPTQRVIGHIRVSPALASDVGPDGFAEDWAAVELDGARFKDAFEGNVIDLGTEIPCAEFILKMYPGDDGATPFTYPSDRLFALRDILTEDAMHHPDTREHDHDSDSDSEACLFVLKNGAATGVTLGRATGPFSFVRAGVSGPSSKAWAILNYDNTYMSGGAFSAPGDSGAAIVDGLGRIGGILIGGAGKAGTTEDVTYATPMFWLWPRVRQHFPDANLYPTAMA